MYLETLGKSSPRFSSSLTSEMERRRRRRRERRGNGDCDTLALGRWHLE